MSKEEKAGGKTGRLILAGVLAGAVNGLFGGGGGMVLLPLLERWGGLEEREVFATSVAVILPVCMVSAGAALLAGGGGELWAAIPYLLGGAAGGLVGGITFRRVPVRWLRLAFALFLLYGAVRYLR